jgi:hypothetical protein
MTETFTLAQTIAKAHGFTLQNMGGGEMAFLKYADDGSYWLAIPADNGDIETVDPEVDAWIVGRYRNTENSEAYILVTEPLALDVALSEHQRIPTPEFDKDGDGMEEELSTWADIRWRGRKGKPNWDKVIRILKEDTALAPVFAAGFDITSTGGGCTAFELVDEEEGTTYLMAAESNVLGHPLSKNWVVQRENEDGVLIGVGDTTLVEALARFRDIPLPTKDQENAHWYLRGWEDYDANGPSATSSKP